MSKRTSPADRVFGHDHDNTDDTTASDPGLALRPRTITPPRPGIETSPRVGHRRQVEIDATSGETLDSRTAQALVHAAHRAGQVHFGAQKDTSPDAYLSHLLSTDRDHGDRAD